MEKIRLILALLALLPFSGAFAQTGEIIYRDFEPDSILIYWHKLGPIWIDLDVDGEADDLMMRMCVDHGICYPELISGDWDNTKICYFESNDPDMILSEVAEEDWLNYVSWNAGATATDYTHYGFRIQQEDGYYYGWFETYSRVISYKNGKSEAHYGFDRTAYCTIPNYPLVWGQTNLVGIEETEANGFAAIHPNPTTGMVIVTGENLRQAEVINTLGQQVLGVQGKGNELHIDMAKLPAGVYLVNITDENGKKCVRKVVKE